MYDFSIALQLYSVRTDMEADFEGTLKNIKALGYDGVEFAGLFGHTSEEVKKMCVETGLTPISAHVPYAELLKGSETFKAYSDIGCKYIVIPWINAEYLAGGEKNAEFYVNVKKFGELANKYGMKLCYHNHDFEFEKVDGEYKLDLLYKAISPELLSTQLDTCWVNVGGENPADYIHKYEGRVEIVHLKDFAGTKGGNMYALIGKDDSKKQAAAGSFEYRPLGSGLQNFLSILDACKEVDAKWIVVEQDQPSMGKTPLECAEASIKYLKSIV
mgnify:CR=1 FL=1